MAAQFTAVHSVHIYGDDDGLISRLCALVATSLRLGDSALIIATAEHRAALLKALEGTGIEVRACVREGRYVMLDAQSALETFMRDGRPDPVLFAQNVGGFISAAKDNARSRNCGLTAFGEMVAILWASGNSDAAIELEELWNQVLRGTEFHLHCAYPRNIFHGVSGVEAVRCLHTHVME
jgi:hypothetical protein